MEVLYISHPYTGNEEENRKEARRITKILASLYPDTVFLSPLDAMRPVDGANIDYDDVLMQTLELMNRCDGVIMTGYWTASKGCQSEISTAISSGKPVYIGAKQYICFRNLKEAAGA